MSFIQFHSKLIPDLEASKNSLKKAPSLERSLTKNLPYGLVLFWDADYIKLFSYLLLTQPILFKYFGYLQTNRLKDKPVQALISPTLESCLLQKL
jgi:hypothetical protein